MITVVEKDRYKLVYESDEDSAVLVRYLINEGYKLFEVAATYAKSLVPPRYYVVGKNKRDAKKIFLEHIPWLNYVFYVKECSADETEIIASSPMKYAII